MLSRRVLIAGAGGIGIGIAAALTFALRSRTRSVQAGLVDEPLGLLSVLPGFEVTLLDKTGDTMSDGFRVPAQPDGMGVLPGPNGKLVLMRNHELWNDPFGAAYAADAIPEHAYDRRAFGGVTRLVVDPDTLAVEHSNLALTGTMRNCSGGTSPWGWLTCEEDISAERHGYTFLCDASLPAISAPRRIDGYGRFRHEAVAIQSSTSIAFLTEDQPDSCLYRFEPKSRQSPFEGELFALVVPGFDDTGSLPVLKAHEARWIRVEPSASGEDDLRKRARAAGAAIVRRGEGMALEERAQGACDVFFSATAGGSRGRGQILRLTSDGDRGELTVLAEASGADELDMPDNLCVGPHGHIFIAEDGDPPNGIRVLSPDGRITTLAINRGAGEVAGICFAPDGDVLFANLQARGVTLAIKGPFADLGRDS